MLAALPEKFLSGFAPEERALHQIVMKDRNELLAHSDHSAWRLRLSVIRSSGRSPMLVPLHRDTKGATRSKAHADVEGYGAQSYGSRVCGASRS
jgi:hypothetical protein